MSLRLGDLGGGQTRTWARPAGRRSPREKTGEAYDPSQILAGGCGIRLGPGKVGPSHARLSCDDKAAFELGCSYAIQSCSTGPPPQRVE